MQYRVLLAVHILHRLFPNIFDVAFVNNLYQLLHAAADHRHNQNQQVRNPPDIIMNIHRPAIRRSNRIGRPVKRLNL